MKINNEKTITKCLMNKNFGIAINESNTIIILIFQLFLKLMRFITGIRNKII